jgi:hypothetical protein
MATVKDSTLIPRYWWTSAKVEAEAFKALLSKDGAQRTFSTEWAKELGQRTRELQKVANRFALLEAVLVLYVLSNILGLNASVSLLGFSVSPESRVFELAVLGLSLLGVADALLFTRKSRDEAMLKTWSLNLAGEEFAEYHIAAFGLGLPITPVVGTSVPMPRVYASPRYVHIALRVVPFLAVVLLGALWLCLLTSVPIAGIWRILSGPTLPHWLSFTIAAVAALAVAARLGLTISHIIPLRYLDYRLVQELAALSKTDPSEFRARMDELRQRERAHLA